MSMTPDQFINVIISKLSGAGSSDVPGDLGAEWMLHPPTLSSHFDDVLGEWYIRVVLHNGEEWQLIAFPIDSEPLPSITDVHLPEFKEE